MEKAHTQCGHTLSQKHANLWNKREMKKSERPQLRNARNPRRNACGQAAAAPPTHRDLGDPRGASRRPAEGGRKGKGVSRTLSGQRPRPARAARVHLKAKAGSSTSGWGTATAASGQPRPVRALGENSPHSSQSREKTKRYSGLIGVCSPSNSLAPPRPGGSAPPSARPAGGRAAARQRSPEERSGGRARHGRRSASLPARYQSVTHGQPRCSLLTPGRTRRPWPLERSVFNGARRRRKASDAGRLRAGGHRHSPPAVGGSPRGTPRRRPLGPPRSGQVAPQPCAGPAPTISAGRSGRRGTPRTGSQTSRRDRRQPPPLSSPVPSRLALWGGIVVNFAPLSPPAALAAGAERGLPAPSSGEGVPGPRPGPAGEEPGGGGAPSGERGPSSRARAAAAVSRPSPPRPRPFGYLEARGGLVRLHTPHPPPTDTYDPQIEGKTTQLLLCSGCGKRCRKGVARAIAWRRNPAPGPGTVSSRPLDSRVCFPSRARPVGVRRRLARLPPRRGRAEAAEGRGRAGAVLNVWWR